MKGIKKMKVIYHEKYIELIPENNYIANLEETDVYKGICGKNINPDDYKDISDEKAEEIFKKQQEEEIEEEDIEEDIDNQDENII